MGSWTDILINAIILDTETTGLARGSGIHELAIYDLEQRKIYEYIIEPQLVFARDRNFAQDVTRLASSSADEHFVVGGITSYPELIAKQVSMDTGVSATNRKAVEEALQWSNAFLYEALKSGKYPHLGSLDGSRPEMADSPQALRAREQAMSGMVGDIQFDLGHRTTMEQLLSRDSALMRKLQGKVIWIANANFESKMIGAHADALERAQKDVAIKSILETSNPRSPDPMYVTGKEVNAARAFAQQTGDWTKVWKAYLANPPKAGETAVRDIQDVIRAFMSYGQKLGLTKIKDQYFGTAIDVTFRLFGSLEADPELARKLLNFDEVHRAAEDAAVSEQYVLRRAAYYTHALQEVAEGTALGRKYLEQGVSGEGPLAEAARYFARLESISGEIQRVNLVKRVARAQEDFLKEGATYQITGTGGQSWMKQQTMSGSEVDVVRAQHQRTRFDRMEDVIRFIDQQDSYAASDTSAADVYRRMQSFLSTGDNQRALLAKFVEQETTTEFQGRRMGSVQAKIRGSADVLLGTEGRNVSRLAASQYTGAAIDALQSGIQGISKSAVGKSALVGAAALTLGGAIWSMADGNPQRPRNDTPSIVAYNYQEWLERQSSYYGNRDHNTQGMDGLQPTGVAARNRKHFTDFGSPYRGPYASNQTLVDQELLREREKWLREQYGARHFDPVDGVFGMHGAFKDINMFGRRGYSYITGGTPIDSQNYNGLKGSGYMAIDVSDGSWKMSVEDVDTIVLQKGGVRGAVASFFGMNKRYKFRMAGIDSTEVTHGFFDEDSGGYHIPQPYAQQSTEAMKQLLSDKKISLVFDPTQTTYGRMLGVVYADGKNMNVEAVKRGLAAHLPFGKEEDAMLNWGALGAAEKQAYKAQRGLWSQPWAQAYYEFSEASGQRITFNTLARKERIVQRSSTMSLIGLMESAQAQGFVSNANRVEAAALGSNYDIGSDRMTPSMFNVRSAPHNSHLHEMLRDQAEFIRTKGTGKYGNKFSRRGGYGDLDYNLTIDTMGTTNNVWNKRTLRSFGRYGAQSQATHDRKRRMAAEQRRINQEFGVSPINHHRM